MAVGVFLSCVVGFAVYDNTHVYEEHYAAVNSKMAAMVSETGGWIPGDDALAVARGTTAWVVYDFYKAAEHRVALEVRALAAPGLTVAVSLHVQDRHIALDTLSGEGIRAMDLTPYLEGHYGVFRIRFDAVLPAESFAASCHPLEGFTLTLSRARRIRWPALFFFAALAGLVYGAIVAATTESLRRLWNRGGRDDRTTTSRPFRFHTLLILSIVVGFGIVASHPGWWARKKFDDVRAISNAATLLDNGFDVDKMFFRGRTRPGFVAWVSPLVRLFPQTVLRVQKTPADFYRKVWEEFDRDNASFTQCLQIEISVFGLGLAGLSLILLVAIGGSLGLPRGALPIVAVAAAIFLRRALEIPVTQIHELFMNLAVVAAWLFWREAIERNPGGRDGGSAAPVAGPRIGLFLAASLMGVAILTKSATITSLIPIGLHQACLALDPRRPARERLRDVARFALYWLVAVGIVFAWFQGFLDGLIDEYAQFWKEHLAAQELQDYESTSLGGIARAFLAVFGIAGLFLVAAGGILLAAGSIRAASSVLPAGAGGGGRATRVHGHFFLWLWILGAMAVFRMPYVFPRFFQYFIPAFAFLAALALWRAVEVLRTRIARPR